MKITKSQLKQLVNEELELVRLERIMRTEQQRIDKLHAEIQQEVLSEDWKKEIPHIGLDVLGLIPGWGEAADLTNAALYAKRGEYLMAALSIVSMIPVVGDIVGKGGKIGIYLSKYGAKGGVKAGTVLGKTLSKHMPKITKMLGSLKSNKLIGKHVDDMAGAVTKYVDDIGTKAADEILPQVQKAIGVVPAAKVSKNKYVALAQKANTKRVARQNRQGIAQNLSGGEGEAAAQPAAPAATAAPAAKPAPAAPAARVPQQQRAATTPSAPAAGTSQDDKVKRDADDVLRQARRRKVAERKEEEKEKKSPAQITPDMINQLLKGVELFAKDPAVVDALGNDGLAGALELIKSKIMAGEQPSAGEEQGLGGVMEVSSEKQRRWACAQKDKPASERADGLSAAEAEEMCKSKIEEDG
jgi:hypothetical protein